MQARHDAEKLPRRRLGRTGLDVPALALGGYPLGLAEVSDEQALACIRYALERGIDYFDTSPMYGACERRLGLALEGVPRDSIRISTKTGSHPARRGDYSRDATMWSVENSLRLLKTDYLDVVHVHDIDWLRPGEGLAPAFGPDGAVEALESLKGQGVVRSIGLGLRDMACHREAIESGRVDVILSFNNYHPLDTAAADWLFPLARQHGVGVINGSPMAHGLLCGRDPDELVKAGSFPPPAVDMLPAARVFYRWCRENGLSIPAVVFQFCLREPLIDLILTGVKSKTELEENLRAVTTPLPDGIWAKLDALGLEALRAE
ncbi:MAG: aldo/keto reductase [Kiritimatiellae bacterium]|nr:aldo/keto reductase [Kiritimatiellia bacterium]